jgi:hypothetical protein
MRTPNVLTSQNAAMRKHDIAQDDVWSWQATEPPTAPCYHEGAIVHGARVSLSVGISIQQRQRYPIFS